MSLKLKLNLFVTFILAFTIIAIIVCCSIFIESKQKALFIDSLERTSKVYSSLVETKRKTLINQSELVGVLPILTTVVEDGDENTIIDTGKNYQKDLDSQIFDIFDVDAELLASINKNINLEKDFEVHQLLAETAIDEGESTSDFILREGKIALLGAAPIGLADDPSGALVIGMYLNDEFAQSIKELTNVEVNFFYNNDLVGSSVANEAKNDFINLFQEIEIEENKNIYATSQELLHVTQLKSSEGETIGKIVLMKPMTELHIMLREIRNYLLIVSCVIFCISIAFGILYAKSITTPIQKAVTFASDLADGKLDEKIEVNRSDELGVLQSSLDKMRLSLKDLIDNLDLKIEEKTRDISLILQHIPTGLITFDLKGKVGSEYSAICDVLFQVSPKENPAVNVMFEDEEKRNEFKSWLDFLPDSPMPFADTAGLAPNEEIIHKNEKTLNLEYELVPIYKKDSEEYEKIMLIARDTTEEKLLKKEMKAKEEKTEFILKVLKSKDGYISFLTELNKCIDELYQIEPNLKGDQAIDNITAAFRSSHTIKGNSSAYGITEIRDAADALETHLMKGRDGEVPLDENFHATFKELLPIVRDEFNAHVDQTEILFGEKFSPDHGGEKKYNISKSEYEAIIEAAQQIASNENLIDLLKKVELEPISILINPYVDQFSSLAERLGKEVNPLVVEGGDTLVNTDRLNSLFSAFVHMVRNSVDHGIEDTDTRTSLNKVEKATVKIIVTETDEELVVVMKDDGKGVNPDIIGKKALEKNIITEEELKKMSKKDIQLLIFAPGFSTNEVVTNVSGRGVGMDAIKHEVEKLGGRIDLESEINIGSTFSLIIPKSYNQKTEDTIESNRQFERYDVVPYPTVAFDNSEEFGKIANISADGMLILTENQAPENEEVDIHIKTNSDTTISLRISVKHVKENGNSYEWGCLVSSFASDSDEESFFDMIKKASA